MPATVLLHDPRPAEAFASATPAVAESAEGANHVLNGLAGKVVGFIDNSKPNFDHLVDDLAALLKARYGVKAVVRHRKPITTVPAGEAVYAELARDCDLVLTGSGD